MELDTSLPKRVISPPRLILKSIVSLGARGFLERAFALIGGVFARRALGPDPIGAFSWTAAVASYPAILVNSGFGTIARRDLARAPQQATRYIGLVLSVQLLMAVVAGLILAVLVFAVDQPNATRWLLALQIIGILLLPLDLSWLLIALERTAPLAVIYSVLGLVRTLCIFLLIRHPADVFWYALIAYPFQIVGTVLIVFYTARHGMVDWLKVRPTLRGAWAFFKESMPIGLTTASIMIYYNSDVVIMGSTRTDTEVGLYSTAYTLMLTVIILTGAILNAMLPSLARAAPDPAAAKRVLGQLLRVLVWVGFPIASLGWAVGRYPVMMLYGKEFSGSGIIFEWLCLNIALMCFNIGYTTCLQFMGHQKQVLYSTLLSAAVNLGANIVLIPLYGIPAAIATTLLGEFVVFLRGFYIRRTLYPMPWLRVVLTPAILALIAAPLARVIADLGFWLPGLAMGLLVIVLGAAFFERDLLLNVRRAVAGNA